MIEFCLLDGMRFDCTRQSQMGTYGGGTIRDKVQGRKQDLEVQMRGPEFWTLGPEVWTGGQEVRRSGGQEVRRSGGQEVRRSGGQEDRRTEEQMDRMSRKSVSTRKAKLWPKDSFF